MRAILAALLIVFASALAAQDAEGPIPPRHPAISRNVDLPGGDLRSIFDTTLDACQNACIANDSCGAFTFNQRNSSCFLKSEAISAAPYQNAISGRIIEATPQALLIGFNRQSELDFLSQSDFDRARSLAVSIGRYHSADELTVTDLLATARSRPNSLTAFRTVGAALSLQDDPALWLEYGRLGRTIPTGDSQELSVARSRALPALINAYLRSTEPQLQATILFEMAQALEARSSGQLMIKALRLAQDIAPRRDAEAALDRAIGLYGFRVAGTNVESDTANPRLCIRFSEDLVQAGTDYAPYLQLPSQDLTVEVQGSQLCVDGVTHGERYRVIVRAGLPAASGEDMLRPVELTLYVRDRSPEVRFLSRAYVLPRTEAPAIPVETVNLTDVELKLYEVSDRNLIRATQEDLISEPLYPWTEDYFTSQIGTEFWTGSATVESPLNQTTLTRLPLAEALAGRPPGVYVLTAGIKGADPYDDPPAAQWFVLSDLGITAMQGVDGMTVAVRALGDAGPKIGAEVALLSRANAVLGRATTDAQGLATFPAGLVRGLGAAAPGMLTVRDGEADMAFLSLTAPAFDLSDRGVEGRAPAGPIDVFVATDRGAYHAGETIWATALMRDDAAAALEGIPLTAILYRPDGVEYARQTSTEGLAGGHVFALPVASTAPRGPWRIEMKSDMEAPPLASASVLVEDFLPERIDFTLELPEQIALGDMPRLTLDARYLFGAPAGDLPIEGELSLSAANSVDAFPGYVFGQYDAPFERSTDSFGGNATGPDGHAELDLDLPGGSGVSQLLLLTVTARVSEGSGRPVERQVSAPVTPDTAMIGIHPEFDGDVPEGGMARFGLIGLSPELVPEPMQVQWTVNRITTRYQWYRLDGRWDWERISNRERIATGTADLGGAPAEVQAPVTWGHYEIVVERTGGDYIASSTDFWAGWYAPESDSSTPDLLEASLDAPSYSPGDTAQLRIVPRFAGTALISVLTNKVIHVEAVEVHEGENLIPLQVSEDWGAGAYVSASVIRPMDVAAGHNPARALGIAYARVDPGAAALQVTLDAPEEIRPRGRLDTTLTIAGLAEGDQAYVTLAAVDVGILNLTGFTPPDPQGHFFGQRKLGVELRDLYGQLIDGLNGALGAVRSGGDAVTVSTMQAPPPTEELVALFSGPVRVGPGGQAQIGFDIPAFNGTVRLMAIAWSPRGVGQASADVIVRDPIVLTASLPRLLAPGDRSRLLIELTHAEGPTGLVDIAIESHGVDIALPAGPLQADLAEGAHWRQSFDLVAGDLPLTAGIDITLTTPGGEVLDKHLDLGIMVNDPPIARISRFTLASGQTFTFNDQVFAGLVPGTGSATLSVGPLARFDAPGLLNALDRYPYGCTEQIASRALPLLYLSSVAEAMGLANAPQVSQRVNEAILEVLGNQASNGAFGLWGAYSGDMWLDAFVTDFLTRARTRGYEVPERALNLALDNLRNQVNYAPDFEQGGEALAYALMVLARQGEAAVGDLRYYVDERAGAFTTPMGAAQMGAALAFYGDTLRADAMFRRASSLIVAEETDPSTSVWRVDYGTTTRDVAAVLALATAAGSDAVDTEALSLRLSRALAAGRPTTQEAVWSLLATDALIDDLRATGVTVGGAEPDGPIVRLRQQGDGAAPVLIANGASPTELTVTTFGVPAEPEPAGGNGFAIERRYYTMEGQEITGQPVATGTRLVAVLTVTPFGRQEARLMVNDPLPGGYEIDNPSLLTSGQTYGLDWLETTHAQSTEFRADRFLAAVDWRSDQPFQLAYILRAVSPGTYHHPAASVEDMYRPQMRARTEAGEIRVTE